MWLAFWMHLSSTSDARATRPSVAEFAHNLGAFECGGEKSHEIKPSEIHDIVIRMFLPASAATLAVSCTNYTSVFGLGLGADAWPRLIQLQAKVTFQVNCKLFR
jgi:hypothetical protein